MFFNRLCPTIRDNAKLSNGLNKKGHPALHQDVIDLKEFYYSDPLGKVTRRILQARLRECWPNMAGERLLGLGFAAPFLRLFKEEATHIALAMPAEQGVMPWPPEGPYVSTLCHDSLLPFPDACFDRVVGVHTIEHTINLPALLTETWRVMSNEAKLVLVVPSRRSMWTRAEATPFGHGKPFSRTQLKTLFRDHGFVQNSVSEALFVPPSRSSLLLKSAHSIENIGRRLIPAFGGVLIVELSKELYRPQGRAKRIVMPDFRPQLAPAPVANKSLSGD